MSGARASSGWVRLLEHSVLTTDVARAVRSSIAFTAAWLVCLWAGQPALAVFVATAAQNVSLQDIRGDYRTRLAILLTMTIVMAVSAFAGILTGNNVLSATLMMGALALLGCVWRHLSGDYGPNLAVISTLLFLIALSQPGNWHAGLLLMGWVALGGACGILLQLAGWCVRPQHALRHAVAESWVAASDLIGALRTESKPGDPETEKLANKESNVRTAVDGTLKVLADASPKHRLVFFQHLDQATQMAARLATRVSALHTALAGLKKEPAFRKAAPALDLLLQSLANTARSAALTLITHRPEQMVALDVRLRRCGNLVRLLEIRLTALPDPVGEVAAAKRMLALVGELLPVMRSTIAETVDHGAAHVTWALRLPELSGMSLRTLSSWTNPAPQIEPVLVRHALRLALLTMLAVAVYIWFQVPRGYWIAFTAIIILQPDYGSTRQKAGQRIVGTVAGCALGSLLLWVKPPFAVIMTLTGITAFFFAYFLKRRYALAIFFVTLMLVLIMEAVGPLPWQFTVARLLSTLAGGTMALLAALFLWPQWEKEQFPKILAAAMRTNQNYLATITTALVQGTPFAGEVVLKKREAERANTLAAASLQRLLGEPANQQTLAERAAALTASNQRLTRELTVLAVHLNAREPFSAPEFPILTKTIEAMLETMADEIETGKTPLAAPHPGLAAPADSSAFATGLIYGQIAKIVAEIEAMEMTKEASVPLGRMLAGLSA